MRTFCTGRYFKNSYETFQLQRHGIANLKRRLASVLLRCLHAAKIVRLSWWVGSFDGVRHPSISPPSAHRCSFVVGTGPPNIQAIQPASFSPTYKISTWTLPWNQTTNVKCKPEYIFKMGIHKRSYRTSVIKNKSIRGFKIFLKSVLKNTFSDWCFVCSEQFRIT